MRLLAKTSVFLMLFSFVFPSYLSATENKLAPTVMGDTVKVGLPMVPGFIETDSNGKPIGFSAEILNQAMEDEKIPFVWIKGEWPDLYQGVINGDIDILPSVQITEERRDKIDFLNYALSTMWSELYLHKKTEFTSVMDLNHKHIGLIQNDNNATGFIQFIKDFNVSYTPVYYHGHSEAMDDLLARKIDAVVGPSARFMSIYFDNVKSSGLVFNPSSVSIAFSKKSSPYLKEALNKRFKIYTEDSNSIYNTLYKKYILNKRKQAGVKFPLYLKILISTIVIILFIGLIFILLLRQQVKTKTRELTLAKEQAEESERRKTIFLANMSHEIRTPLNSILGYSQMLSDESIDFEERRQFAKIIHRQNNLLLRLINDIIEISRIDSGTVQINKNFIKRIDPILSDTYDNFVPLCPDGIALKMSNELPAYITDLKIDVLRVKQILSNLLSNALKYSKTGEVVLRCRLNKEGHLEFSVSDQGEGISEEDLPRVFDRHKQLNVNSPGSGLGLAICKLLAELMDGEMSVESALGKGSIFTLTLTSFQ